MNLDIANMVLNIGQNSSKDWIDNVSALGPTLMGLFAFLAAIIANLISNTNLKQQNKQFSIQLKEERRNLQKQLNLQKEQWLNDAYIKNEAEKIIQFRNMVYQAEKSFFWFSDILRPYKTMAKMFPEQDVKLKEDALIVKFDEYCLNYDKLNELNIFYNNNQMILKKNGIDDEFIYITAILSSFMNLNEIKDFHYSLYSEDEKCVRYKLDIINRIGGSFLSSIELQKNQSFNIGEPETKLQEYADKILSTYYELKHKLDKLITFYDGELPENLKIIRTYNFPSSADYKKYIKNKEGGDDL